MPTVPEAVRPPADRPPRADADEWARMRPRLVVTSHCWIYVGALADDGYGRFWAPPRVKETRSEVVRPSRWMWAAHYGPIPASCVVRHECDRSICARPQCLLLGDQSENLLDASRRDRITHMGRVGKADRRGTYRAALAIRTAVLEAVADGVYDPDALAAVVTAAQLAGDPYGEHGRLFQPDDLTGPPTGSVRSSGGVAGRSAGTAASRPERSAGPAPSRQQELPLDPGRSDAQLTLWEE